MNIKHSHLEIALKSISCFQSNGRLDVQELDALVAIAERDGSINPQEAQVLDDIIQKISPGEIDAAMKERIEALKKKLAAVG